VVSNLGQPGQTVVLDLAKTAVVFELAFQAHQLRTTWNEDARWFTGAEEAAWRALAWVVHRVRFRQPAHLTIQARGPTVNLNSQVIPVSAPGEAMPTSTRGISPSLANHGWPGADANRCPAIPK
jgi:hypothetical protein